MKKKQQEQILFSCLGSTDPVRGLHDGSMLHIARHYRPAKIFWYITAEMRKQEERDDRYRRSIEELKKQCPGYEPEILEPYYDDREDVSDFDAFYEIFGQLLDRLTRQYPDAELLLNLSSGTPQMKMTLALLAGELTHKVRAVQVKNFERRSGTSDRTTSGKYDLDGELELNEDADSDAENRCSEPKLIMLQRKQQRDQIVSLLHRYDYEALHRMEKKLPAEIRQLVEHLALRSAYDKDKAVDAAKGIRDIELYPSAKKKEESYREYFELSEYILILKLMQRTQRYTDMVIRLNPLVIRLQRAWLTYLGIDFPAICETDWKGKELVRRENLSGKNPELLAFLDSKYFPSFKDCPLNITLCNYLLEYLKATDSDEARLFRALGWLNEKRNQSAHNLKNVTEEDIRHELGFGSEELIKKLIGLLKTMYPDHYREELFSVYDTANKYIEETL